ncbi:MAG: hypothetical protein H0U66_06110 [Gemmatimonadaceae bacterium]|nr:hypothetical protein [Gemmatimonadaceae bacterium]
MFGSYRVGRWNSTGTLELIQEGLFHADDLGEWYPEGLAVLREYAARESIPLRSRRKFMDTTFYQVAAQMRALVVGFNLPFDLSRLAVDAGEARGWYYGGFSFTLWDYRDKSTEKYRPNLYRPSLRIKHAHNKAAFIGFANPMRSDDKTTKIGHGNFLDLRTIAYALSAEGHSLASACVAFGVRHGKLEMEEHGRITCEYIDYNRRDVLASQELLERVRVEFDKLSLPLRPTKAFSPASIAKATLRAMGIKPPITKAPSFTPSQMGDAMTAFYGGRAECRVRRTPVSVVTVDFRSMYPTVDCLMGVSRLLSAETIRWEDYAEQFRLLLQRASMDAAFTRELWPQLMGFVEIEPDDDILPVRAKYSETSDGLNIGVNHLTSSVPFVYAAPDVYASALLTGKPARVRRAWRMVGEGQQAGMKPINLGGTIEIDPYTDDLFRLLIEERVRVKTSAELPREEIARVELLLKIIANSGGYGIFAELNREDLPSDKSASITVFSNGGSFEQMTEAPEDAGEFCFAPIAAMIAAAARLMLAILERCVTDLGGTYAFCDTDSMAIVASETGGLLACEGGPLRTSDGAPAIQALSWREVQAIQSRFDALSPYDLAVIPSILNVEKVNFAKGGGQREIMAYVVSAKRYVLYHFDDDGSLVLDKCSKHGLGHLLSPLPTDSTERWPEVLWRLILCEALGIPHEAPEWLKLPAITRVSVRSPSYFRGFLRRHADMPYAERIKPFGFLIACQVARFGHPEGANPKAFHLLSPYSVTPSDWASQLWTDTYSGNEYAVTTALSYQPGVVRVRSIADIKAEFLAHGEVKSATADGEPAGASSRGLLQRRHVTPSEIRLIGKESNSFELVEAGLIGDWREILSSYTDNENRPSEEQLMTEPAVVIARRWNVSVRTVRAWRRRVRESRYQ